MPRLPYPPHGAPADLVPVWPAPPFVDDPANQAAMDHLATFVSGLSEQEAHLAHWGAISFIDHLFVPGDSGVWQRRVFRAGNADELTERVAPTATVRDGIRRAVTAWTHGSLASPPHPSMIQPIYETIALIEGVRAEPELFEFALAYSYEWEGTADTLLEAARAHCADPATAVLRLGGWRGPWPEDMTPRRTRPRSWNDRLAEVDKMARYLAALCDSEVELLIAVAWSVAQISAEAHPNHYLTKRANAVVQRRCRVAQHKIRGRHAGVSGLLSPVIDWVDGTLDGTYPAYAATWARRALAYGVMAVEAVRAEPELADFICALAPQWEGSVADLVTAARANRP